MTLFLALVLSAAPVVSITNSEVKVNGKTVMGTVPDDGMLNLPQVGEALRELGSDAGAKKCVIAATSDVAFKSLKRVIFTVVSAQMTSVTLEVEGREGFNIFSPFDGHPDTLTLSPVAITARLQGAAVNVSTDAGVPSPEELESVFGQRAAENRLILQVDDEVSLGRLADVATALRAARITVVNLVPSNFKSAPSGAASNQPLVMGSLDKELIRKVIHANRGQIRNCYEKTLTRTPDLAGKVAVKFVISAAGPVSTAEITGAPLDQELGDCMIKAVRTWVFPKPRGGGVVVVTYPFIFNSTK